MARLLWRIYRRWLYHNDDINEIVSMISVNHLCSLEVYDLQQIRLKSFSPNIAQCIDMYWALCENIRLNKSNQIEPVFKNTLAFNWLCDRAVLLDRERFFTGLLSAVRAFCSAYDQIPDEDSLSQLKRSMSGYRVHATELLLQLGEW